MSKEISRMSFLISSLNLSRIHQENFWEHFFSNHKEVTRALEPTYSQRERELILLEISMVQKELNRQKNILSKISKELRNHSS